MKNGRQNSPGKIAQMRKMEALGVLAGGIAHDFNNILGPIVGYTDLCIDMVPRNIEMTDYLEEIKKAAKTARTLVRQILSFSRQGEMVSILCYPGSIVKETVKLMRPSMPCNIKIDTQISGQTHAGDGRSHTNPSTGYESVYQRSPGHGPKRRDP